MKPTVSHSIFGFSTLLAVLLVVSTALADFPMLQLTPPNAVRDGRVEAELIAEHTGLMPGETTRVGLRLKMDEGWHTYWKNPGDSGLATSIDWDLPEGFEAGPIEWPAPHYFEVGGLASFGYEGEIVLPVLIQVPEDLTGNEVTLRATADWLVCKETCEAGSAALSITVPVTRNPSNLMRNTTHEALFAWSKDREPERLAEGYGNSAWSDSGVTLTVREVLPSQFDPASLAVRFFPADPQAIAMNGPQAFEVWEGRGLRVSLTNNAIFDPPERLRGVLVIRRGEQLQPIDIDLPVRGVAAGGDD